MCTGENAELEPDVNSRALWAAGICLTQPFTAQKVLNEFNAGSETAEDCLSTPMSR